MGPNSLNDAEAGWLWRAIEAEMVPPDFITPYGPLTPGFYLNSATTNAELDRIAALFEVRLAFADVLIAGIQNNYLDSRRTLLIRIRNVFTSKDEWAWRLRSELYDRVHIFVRLIKLQFGKAREAATMLDNDEIYTRLSKSWLTADRALAHFSTWDPQRVFLPHLSKSEIAKRNARTASLRSD